MSLDELTRSVHERAEFRRDELQFIKRAYRDSRKAFKSVLLETTDDEFRTLAIAYALRSFERGDISPQDCLSDVMYAYRVLQDLPIRGHILRTEVAYHTALAALFFSGLQASALPRRITPSSIELLHQLRELAAALKTYTRWQKRQATIREAEAVTRAA
jgi:hypothetical protein